MSYGSERSALPDWLKLLAGVVVFVLVIYLGSPGLIGFAGGIWLGWTAHKVWPRSTTKPAP
jgi:hypothetical protein